MIMTLSSIELLEQLNNPGSKVVDIRPMAAYNGWRLHNEARGGHLPGAVAIPLSWIESLEPADLKDLLLMKGVTPKKAVIIYGYSPTDGEKAAAHLAGINFNDVRIYTEGHATWAADLGLPLERLPRFHKLVHPGWLAQVLDGDQPEFFDGRDFRLFHVAFNMEEEYLRGHIPGAVYLDTLGLESPDNWNRRPAPELRQMLTDHGIRHDQTVILYGHDSDPDMSQEEPGRRAGQIAATRAAAILMYAGVDDVRLLDGGFDSWLAAGLQVDGGRVQPTPAGDFGVTIPARPDLIIDLADAKRLLDDWSGSALVSIRSWDEYIGDTSGYHYIGPSGRIAGAVWGNCGTDAYHMQHYRNVDNTMRAYPEIEENWRSAGIIADKEVAFYCGTGWRASETFFYAHLLGWDRVAVYDGGWFEWSADQANPTERGQPQPGR